MRCPPQPPPLGSGTFTLPLLRALWEGFGFWVLVTGDELRFHNPAFSYTHHPTNVQPRPHPCRLPTCELAACGSSSMTSRPGR